MYIFGTHISKTCREPSLSISFLLEGFVKAFRFTYQVHFHLLFVPPFVMTPLTGPVVRVDVTGPWAPIEIWQLLPGTWSDI